MRKKYPPPTLSKTNKPERGSKSGRRNIRKRKREIRDGGREKDREARKRKEPKEWKECIIITTNSCHVYHHPLQGFQPFIQRLIQIIILHTFFWMCHELTAVLLLFTYAALKPPHDYEFRSTCTLKYEPASEI